MERKVLRQSIVKQNPSKIQLSSFCVGHLLLDMGPGLKYGLYLPSDLRRLGSMHRSKPYWAPVVEGKVNRCSYP